MKLISVGILRLWVRLKTVKTHDCQPFTERPPDDPAVDDQFKEDGDPWCWSPEVGFHRRSQPAYPVMLLAARNDEPRISETAVEPHQAFHLGLGLGTNIGGVKFDPQIPEVFSRALEVTGSNRWVGDVEPIAWYGYRCRGVAELLMAVDDYSRRVVFEAATRFVLPRLTEGGAWVAVLSAALEGSNEAGNLEWQTKAEAGYKTCQELRRMGVDEDDPAYRQATLDENAGVVYNEIISGEPYEGLMSSIGRLFTLTNPSTPELGEWLMFVARTAQQRVTE